MSEKEKDLEAIKQNISHKPIDYDKLNRLTEDFRKRFTPQQELSAEQAFWLRMSDPTSKPSDALPVKIEAPKELPNSGPGLHLMTPATSSSGLVPNPVSQQPCIPPPRDDWDRLFQPMFDEYFTPLSIAVSPVQEVVASRAVVLADSPVSNSID
ncbi:hypothetical protein Tco_0656309 [Tanacetum coccineum]|uniref:Uncharacterized protein n=1 Tax=Tanacetum coccineum TaxID=301880 RepID=A0ABQ4X9L6_9ASTR